MVIAIWTKDSPTSCLSLSEGGGNHMKRIPLPNRKEEKDTAEDKSSYSPEFTTSEAGGAQLQALHTLSNAGWQYVTRAEADQWRDGRRTLPFLEEQVREDIARVNRIYLNERPIPFPNPISMPPSGG